MLKASWAVTLKLNDDPAVSGEGAVTEKWVAAPGFTLMLLEVPVMVVVTVSVAVRPAPRVARSVTVRSVTGLRA